MKELNRKSIESNKSGDQCDYLVVDQLPTNFRSYEVDQVFVRGLFYEESAALAKYIGTTRTPNYRQLASIYNDVIRGVDIMDLELVDFIVLMIISSIWTVDDFGWDPNIRCSNVLDSGHQCDGVIHDKITLDDFEFDDPLIQDLPIPVTVKGKSLSIGALTVRDVIEKEKQLELDPDSDKKLLDYVSLIKNTDMSYEDKMKLIKYSYTKDLKQISQVDSEIHIQLKPLIKKCPSCSHPNKLKIGLTKIRGYP